MITDLFLDQALKLNSHSVNHDKFGINFIQGLIDLGNIFKSNNLKNLFDFSSSINHCKTFYFMYLYIVQYLYTNIHYQAII